MNFRILPSLRCVTFMLLGAFVGTGAYVVAPIVLYILAACTALLYLANLSSAGFRISLPKVGGGGVVDVIKGIPGFYVLVVYFIFLLLNYLRDMNSDISRIYINFVTGLFIYLVIQGAVGEKTDFFFKRYLPALALLVIFGGLILEILGKIDFRGLELGGDGADGVFRRPGGFLNPNMSAALGLIWLYVALECDLDVSFSWRVASLLGCLGVLALTQSRAAILFLFLYFCIKIFEVQGRALIRSLIIFFIFSFLTYISLDGELLFELLQSVILRFEGDANSVERLRLLEEGVKLFEQAPLLGFGMRALYTNAGLGTHNELVEWLLNFGLIGLAVGLFVLLKFYYVNSMKYVFMCLLPTLLFSHNFFEATAFQVSLSFAYRFRVV